MKKWGYPEILKNHCDFQDQIDKVPNSIVNNNPKNEIG